MNDTITILIHRVAGHAPESEVVVATDSEGTPLDLFWRRRLRDAERDNCCEVLSPAAPEPPAVDDWEEEPER